MKTNKIAALLLTLAAVLSLCACGNKEEESTTVSPTAAPASASIDIGVENKEYQASYQDSNGNDVYQISYTLPEFPPEDEAGQKINAYFGNLFETAKSNGVTFSANLSNLEKPWRESAACTVTYADDDYVSFDITVQLDSGSGDELLSRSLSTFSRQTGLRMTLDSFATSEQAFNYLSSSVITQMQENYNPYLPDGATVFSALDHQAFCLTANGFRVCFAAGSVTLADSGPVVIDFAVSDFKGYFDDLPNMK